VSRAVTRADRARDLTALLLLLAGAALYGYAWFGMHNLATHHLLVPKGVAAMRYFDTYWQMFLVARVILVIGAGTLVWSFWHYSKRPDTPA
jgi:heme/copper-type cytochrome/quinol oxidase subunit 2